MLILQGYVQQLGMRQPPPAALLHTLPQQLYYARSSPLLFHYDPPQTLNPSEMWASLQTVNYSRQHREENAFKGSVGIIYTYISIYLYISPALPAGCGEALDGGGDLIQLWILMNPLLYDGRESRKLWTWPKSCKNVSDAAAEDC